MIEYNEFFEMLNKFKEWKEELEYWTEGRISTKYAKMIEEMGMLIEFMEGKVK